MSTSQICSIGEHSSNSLELLNDTRSRDIGGRKKFREGSMWNSFCSVLTFMAVEHPVFYPPQVELERSSDSVILPRAKGGCYASSFGFTKWRDRRVSEGGFSENNAPSDTGGGKRGHEVPVRDAATRWRNKVPFSDGRGMGRRKVAIAIDYKNVWYKLLLSNCNRVGKNIYP